MENFQQEIVENTLWSTVFNNTLEINKNLLTQLFKGNDLISKDEEVLFSAESPETKYLPTDKQILNSLGCNLCGHKLKVSDNFKIEDEKLLVTCSNCNHKDIEVQKLDASYHYGANNLKCNENNNYYVFKTTEKIVSFDPKKKKWWQSRFKSTFSSSQDSETLLDETLEVLDNRAIVEEVCEKCNHNKAYYSTFQARSADEGSTILFECMNCSYKKVLNS